MIKSQTGILFYDILWYFMNKIAFISIIFFFLFPIQMMCVWLVKCEYEIRNHTSKTSETLSRIGWRSKHLWFNHVKSGRQSGQWPWYINNASPPFDWTNCDQCMIFWLFFVYWLIYCFVFFFAVLLFISLMNSIFSIRQVFHH